MIDIDADGLKHVVDVSVTHWIAEQHRIDQGRRIYATRTLPNGLLHLDNEAFVVALDEIVTGMLDEMADEGYGWQPMKHCKVEVLPYWYLYDTEGTHIRTDYVDPKLGCKPTGYEIALYCPVSEPP